MNGFEYQVAAHMIYEGAPDSDLVTNGLAIARAIHERYGAAKRNPYNEIECSDHYARSMASYGVFLATCGFEYHGPKQHIGFSPRVSPDSFRAPFTSAEGWGTFSQQRSAEQHTAVIDVAWGRLALKTIALAVPDGLTVGRCVASLGNSAIDAQFDQTENRVLVTLGQSATLTTDAALTIKLT